MFDRDSLYNYVWETLRDEIGDNTKTDYLTDRICDAVSEWVPKKGDFWLNEDDGVLYVNKGWEVVCVEALENPESNALQALDNLYNDNSEGMERLAAE